MIMHSCYFYLLFIISSLYVSAVVSQSQSNFVKGIRGGEATLVCIPDVASATVSWLKTSRGSQDHVASSVQGSYQFSDSLKNRASLSGGNLTISPLTLSDEGNYTCNVITAEFLPQSSIIVLTVTAAPVVRATAAPAPNIDSNGTYVAAICVAKLGKPAATIQWTNQAGNVQDSRSQETQNDDGSWNVTAELILTPGLLGRDPYSPLPLSSNETRQIFICDVIHEDLKTPGQRRREVTVDLLFSPITHVSILGNRLTCHAQGNPQPSVKWHIPSGQVIENQNALLLGQTATYNGRYSCLASSSLKPDSISVFDVQKARDLPVLFRTLVTLNTSLPTTASGYEIQCSAEVDNNQNFADDSFEIEWTKNGEKITGNSYQIVTKTEQIHSLRTRLVSSFTFLDVVQERDDAIFQCRFVNSSSINGFVTAVERSISISVDYPPDSILIASQPHGFRVVEGNTLTLSCLAGSKPLSTYQWYFKDKNIHTGNELTLNDIDRSNAGSYRCVAYNYVPGSARDDVTVTVFYRPSDVVIVEMPEGALSCEAMGGSEPGSSYHWVYPNSTVTTGNISVITLPPPPSEGAFLYTCVASNNLGAANSTYIQRPPAAVSIGTISLTGFIILLVVSVLITLLVIGFVVWFFRRRRRFVDMSKKMSAEEAFKQYLQFAEPPGAVKIGGKRSSSSAKPTSGTSDTLPSTRKPQLTSHLEIGHDDAAEMNDTETIQHPPMSANDSSTLQTRISKPHSSMKEEDGVEEDFPHPSAPNSVSDDAGFGSIRGAKALVYPLHSNSTCSPRTTEEYQDSESTLPSESRLPSIHPDVARHMHAPAMIPLQYFQSRNSEYEARIPLHMRMHHPPVRVLASGYDPTLHEDRWASSNPHLNINSPRHYTTSTFGHPLPVYQEYPLEEATSVSSIPPVDNYTQNKNIRPRSMSLSASSSCSRPSSSLSSNAFERTDKGLLNTQPKYMTKDRSPSRTLSPFDSGNDSGRSVPVYLPAKKHPSLTLV